MSPPPKEPVVRHSNPMPPGYVFVPKGNVYITGNCRRQTQASRQTVYAVANQDKKTLGIRVPAAIHDAVRAAEASTRRDRAAAVQKRDVAQERVFRDAVLRLFPRTPSESVPRIVARAMQKGSGRVGRSGKLDVEAKATLAVRAHIRHVHTEYDAMLRKGLTREKARDQALEKINDVVKAWGGRVVQRTQKKGAAKKGSGGSTSAKGNTATKVMAKTVAIKTANTSTNNAGPRETPSKGQRSNSRKAGQSPRERRFQKFKVRQARCDIETPSPTKPTRSSSTGKSLRDTSDTDDESEEYEGPETDDEDIDWTP